MTSAIAPIDPRKKKYLDLRDFLTTRKDQVSAIAGRALDPERVLKIVLDAAASTPKLLQCSPESLLRAMLYCAKVQLEPVGAWGVWLVPYGENVTPIIDYRALMSLVKRSGDVRTIVARAVYANDEFAVDFGDEEKIVHRPEVDSEKRGALVAVYAIATMKDGIRQREVMSRADVDRIRAKSRASGSGPWVSDYEAMALKTVIRRLCKFLPIAFDTARALEEEDKAQGYEPTITIDAETGDVKDETPPAQPSAGSKVENIKADLRARREPTPDITIDAAPEPPPGTTTPSDTGEAPAGDERPNTDELREQLDAIKAEIAGIAPDRVEALWNGLRGPGSLRGVRTREHAQVRIDRAEALLAAVKRGEV